MEFGPKEIQAPSKMPDVRLFFAMNKRLYAKYHDVFLSEITWIIEAGRCTVFLRRVPVTSALKIKNVALRLSPQDRPDASVDFWLQHNKSRIEALVGDFSEVLYLFMQHARLHDGLMKISTNFGAEKLLIYGNWDHPCTSLWT